MASVKTPSAGAEPPGIGGYLRVSRVLFPLECRTPAARAAHIDAVRQIRRRELEADAARNGEVITAWYDDIGVSGRGDFYPKRTGFARARRDAKDGKLRALYARDLSRLFRNVVQQELWFSEMEDCGTIVHAQDLPFASDLATRRLLRQQMGIIHEYVSSRLGATVRERMRTRVQNDLSTVFHASYWGLHYNSERQAFDFDPDTADKVRLVFEVLIECGGNASHAARQLNLMLAKGHPRATTSPDGRTWYSQLVLSLVRSARYRREIQYGDLVVPSPHRIPEVVPAETVAQADALLAARSSHYLEAVAKRQQYAGEFTYLQFLRCGFCGSPLIAQPNSYDVPAKEIASVAYVCRANHGAQRCPAPYYVQQVRLHQLVYRGLQQAFAAYFGIHPISQTVISPETDGTQTIGTEANSLAEKNPNAQMSNAQTDAIAAELTRLDRKRERYLELYASGLIRDQAELDSHLQRVASEYAFIQQPFIFGEREKPDARDTVSSAGTGGAGIISDGPEAIRGLALPPEVEARYRQFQELWPSRPKATSQASTEQKSSREEQVSAENQLENGQQPQTEGEGLAQGIGQDNIQSEENNSSTGLHEKARTEKARRGKVAGLKEIANERIRVYEPVTEQSKQKFLKSLRASIIVRVFPLSTGDAPPLEPSSGFPAPVRPTRNRALLTGEPYSVGGRVTIALELPTLGMIGVQAIQVSETNDDMADYWEWRNAKPNPARNTKPSPAKNSKPNPVRAVSVPE